MKEKMVRPCGHFAAMLSSAMDELDLSIGELSRQVGISQKHARRLQKGKALPDRLLLEKTSVATGVPLEELQVAVQRDRTRKKSSSQVVAESPGTSKRIGLFEPLINALRPDQMPTAYAMLERLAKKATLKQRPGQAKRRAKSDLNFGS